MEDNPGPTYLREIIQWRQLEVQDGDCVDSW